MRDKVLNLAGEVFSTVGYDSFTLKKLYKYKYFFHISEEDIMSFKMFGLIDNTHQNNNDSWKFIKNPLNINR